MIEAREVLTGKVNVGTKEVYPPLVDLEATPTKEAQEFNHDGEYGYDKVKVNPIPDEYIIPNGELDINANGEVDVTTFRMARVGVYTPPTLQDKSIEITENGTTNITADEGFDGLSKVEITTNAIEDLEEELIDYNNKLTTQKTSIQDIVTALASKQAGSADFGIKVISYYDTKANYPKEIEIYGSIIPYKAFWSYDTSSSFQGLGQYLEKVTIMNGVSEIKNLAFAKCSTLSTINLPNTLTKIGNNAFMNTPCANIKYLPDSVIDINKAFDNSSITQLSMNVETLDIDTYTAESGTFWKCTKLCAVWIGSKVQLNKFGFGVFGGCTKMKKIFIDLPRATVEANQYYYCAWSCTKIPSYGTYTFGPSVIVCNDDEGWMTREEFDAIDWTTYTE